MAVETQDPRAIWESLTPEAQALITGGLRGMAEIEAAHDELVVQALVTERAVHDWCLTDLGRAVAAAGQEGA